MSNYAEEPLTKVTINLFKKDVDWFREKYPRGWMGELRKAIRRQVMKEAQDAQ